MSQSRRQLRGAWGQFLSQFPWDWFVTLTFRNEVPTFRAYRMVESFLRDIEADAGVPIHWFRGDEYGPRLGRLHMHLLIGNVAHLRRLYWMDEWNVRAGYARILPFDDNKRAAFYVAKYITKQGGEWAMSDNLGRLQTQPILPLEGSRKPSHVVQDAANDGIREIPRPLKKPNVQKPMFTQIAAHRPSPIAEVYRAEVTRFGKCRFRQFF